MGDSFTEPASVTTNLIRSFFSFLDRPAYWLLGLMYELFFNVASADLFSNGTIMKFYGRVQVILGVFMMFQLAMTILKGIVNPDSFTDSKSGAGNLLTRVATSLILITVLMPINVSVPRNEYEKQISNNGLLFGTLYSLQHRILSNNTIGRLVLGTTGNDTSFKSTSDSDSELKRSARIFTSTILKGFYRINLVLEDQRTADTGTKDPATDPRNRMCPDIDGDILELYTSIDADPGDIISLVNATCESNVKPGFLNNLWTGVNTLLGTTKYAFTYMPVISTIVAIIFVFILLSFTIDVAVRAVKLAVLRLIAPIPIISYMDPKGSKDSSFNAWVKALTSTYLDLFIRLAVVYFVIFIIQDMIVNGIVIDNSSGIIHILSIIIIWIGLFIFAKQAPKFIKQILGIKDDGGKLFSGFGEIGAAVGMAAAIPGAIGSGIASARASRMADETRQSFGETDIFGRPVNPNRVLNRGKHLLAGITGGVSGGVTGIRSAATAKEHGFNASVEAMRKRNADILGRGNNGSTLFGRIGSTASNIFTGEGAANATDRTIETNKSRLEALKAVKSRVTGEMVKKDWTTGRLGLTDAAGNDITANYKQFMAAYNASKAAGGTTVTFRNTATGHDETITMEQAELQQGFLLKNNEDNYISQHVNGTVAAGEVDNRLLTLIHNAEILGGSSDFTRNADGTITKGSDKHITGRASITDAIDGFEDYNTQLSRQNAINKANDQYSGSKK